MKLIHSFYAASLICMLHGTSSIAQTVNYKQGIDNRHQYERYDQLAVLTPELRKGVMDLRAYYVTNPHRSHSLRKCKTSLKTCRENLLPSGQFRDLAKREQELKENRSFTAHYQPKQHQVGLLLSEAFNRIWRIADAHRTQKISLKGKELENLYAAIRYYAQLELDRPNDAPRFHASCFAMPTAAVNIYFALMPLMEHIEKGEGVSAEEVETCDKLKAIALQAWTQPFRQDFTDENIVQIERFRNHVWWVGGNALGYRSLLPVAAMLYSAEMIDLLADVAKKGISMTSQRTYSDSFWTEGFTADGAGWGHGMQCLIWGYPIDGTANALALLDELENTPWEKKLSRENVESMMNYFRGSSWYYYKGYHLPCLSRGSMAYTPEAEHVKYRSMLDRVLKKWSDSLTEAEKQELVALRKEVDKNHIAMSGREDGFYQGTRYFFNNDDLIKNTDDYHVIVNMASVRCDGLESATELADEYNFYSCDGLTLFQREGNEYSSVYGAFDVTKSPGVTSRYGMDQLEPVTNWRGYCSRHNYAGAATWGDEYAVAGFHFDKMNASTKEGVNDKGDSKEKNTILYGFNAYKANFMMGDYHIALGAGITDYKPYKNHSLHTTIDQRRWDKRGAIQFDGKKLKEGEHTLEFSSRKVQWLQQEGQFAYTLLPEFSDRITVTLEDKPTSWVERNIVNRKKKDLPQEASIFTVGIDHGQNANDAKYGYALYLGEGRLPKKLPFQVVANDDKLQAVVYKQDGKQVVGAVFYDDAQPLVLETNKLSVSKPAIVLIEEDGDLMRISVTDPAMDPTIEQITVTYKGRSYPMTMPKGLMSGKPSVKEVKI